MYRCFKVFLLSLLALIFILLGKAEAIDDNFTFTRVDLVYSDTSRNTTINMNTSLVLKTTGGDSQGPLVIPNNSNIPDGTITGIKLYANYSLGNGRGNGSITWGPDLGQNKGLPLQMSGGKSIVMYFTYASYNDMYSVSRVSTDASSPTPTPTPEPPKKIPVTTTVMVNGVAVTITVSSAYNDNYGPGKAMDGVYGAWDEYEWASNGEMTPTIQFKWATAWDINKVILCDRCNPIDHIEDAWLRLRQNGVTKKSIHVGMFPYGGSAKEIIFDTMTIDEIFLEVVDGCGLNVGLSELQAFYDPNVKPESNLALTATVIGSTYYNDTYGYSKANDGIYGAWDEYEWASKGEMTPWINFKWNDGAHTIKRVVLYDRCNPVDHIKDAWMILKKDGKDVKSIHVGMFPFGGAAKEINFDPISIDEIRLNIVDGWGLNVGLSELQVFEE